MKGFQIATKLVAYDYLDDSPHSSEIVMLLTLGQLVVQVSKTLVPQTHTNKLKWQFFAELLAACRYNLNINQQKEAQVYGCLTDANIYLVFLPCVSISACNRLVNRSSKRGHFVSKQCHSNQYHRCSHKLVFLCSDSRLEQYFLW